MFVAARERLPYFIGSGLSGLNATALKGHNNTAQGNALGKCHETT
jgi:hypothetical protein